jgi:class 3 adenylate cyclase
VRRDLPTGTVTLLFSDVEGSTTLLRELGAGAYADALAEHRRIVRAACTAEGGVEVDNQGDAFFFAFRSAPSALAAAQAVTRALAAGQVRVRIGIHTGTPLVRTPVESIAEVSARGVVGCPPFCPHKAYHARISLGMQRRERLGR